MPLPDNYVQNLIGSIQGLFGGGSKGKSDFISPIPPEDQVAMQNSQDLAKTYGGGQTTNNPQEGGNTWTDFMRTAAKVAKQEQYPLSVLLGQAAMETGRDPNNAPGNNWFGMKGEGTGGSNNLATQEFGGGGYYNENDDFASYKNMEDSIHAYINTIKRTPTYKEAYKTYSMTKDPSRLLSLIKGSGYATSPTYAQDVSQTPEYKYYAGKGN